jgi:hypothetical protein
VLQVHDEFVVEVENDEDGAVSSAKEVLELEMAAAFTALLPDAPITGLVDAHAGPNWAAARRAVCERHGFVGEHSCSEAAKASGGCGEGLSWDRLGQVLSVPPVLPTGTLHSNDHRRGTPCTTCTSSAWFERSDCDH